MTIFYIDLQNGSDAAAGTSWGTAWKTITSGATAARVTANDSILISKTPDPVSIGTATWTNGSSTLTLSAAQTKTVDLCESGWVAAGASTVTYNTNYEKQGTNALNVTKASYLPSTLYAYKALGSTQDFSAYQELSFWLSCDSPIAADTWKICLCSDAAGTIPIDTIVVPALANSNRPTPFVVARTGGGNLGASIQSVALWSHTSTPTAGLDIRLDCIIATATGGLNLTSVVGKDASATSVPDGVWPVQSIDGTTLIFDRVQSTTASVGAGIYYGTSETVTSYHRTGYAVAASQVIQEAGTTTAIPSYSGGWNTASGLQDGETLLDGRMLASTTYVLSCAVSYVSLSRLSTVRGDSGGVRLGPLASADVFGISYASAFATGCNIGVTVVDNSSYIAVACTADVSSIASVNYGMTIGGRSTVVRANAIKNAVLIGLQTTVEGSDIHAYIDVMAGVNTGVSSAARTTTLHGCTISGVTNVCVSTSTDSLYLQDCTLSGTESGTSNRDGIIYSDRHDASVYFWQFHGASDTINSQASSFSGGTDAEVRLSVASSARTNIWPLSTTVAQYAVAAGALVTIEALLKKSHATNIDGRLVVRGGQILGVPDDVVATLADNTSEQTLTLTFTPTTAGVVEVECWAEYSAAIGSVYIDSITCTQA